MATEIDWWDSGNIFWVGLAGIVGWLVRTERRFGKFMTRDEHNDICMKRNDAFSEVLHEIKTTLERSSEQRTALLDKISDMRADIATLKERTARPFGEA